MATFEELVETGRLMMVVPRRDMRKWSAYVNREVGLRPGLGRLDIIRQHLTALDAKAGALAGVAGLLLAACGLYGAWLFAQPELPTDFLVTFAIGTISSVFAAVYAMSALSVEQPEDAAVGDDEAFTFRLLQRLVYRSRNHGWGLRSAQFGAFMLTFSFMGAAAEQLFDLYLR